VLLEENPSGYEAFVAVPLHVPVVTKLPVVAVIFPSVP